MSQVRNNPILITIVTIVYNGEKFLEDTIKSVISQSYSNIEYIIIDGGSTDGTLNIIKKYEKYISKFISEKDKGISDAFNKGISLANGELVGLLNADDYYEKDAILNIVGEYSNNNEIICGNVKLYKNDKIYNIKKSSTNGLNKQMTIWHPGMFCPKKVYDLVGQYNLDYRILMDYDFVVRALLIGVKFKFLDVNVSNMRYGGVSNKLINASMRESLSIKNKYFGNRLRHYIEYVYFQFFYTIIIFIKNLMYK